MSTVRRERASERGIIFSGPMVRALLDGKKTQSRRIVDESRLRVWLGQAVSSDLPELIQPALVAQPDTYHARMNQYGAVSVHVNGGWLGVKPGEFHFKCPYAEGRTHLGQYGEDDKRWTIAPSGSRLWVRETFCVGYPIDESGKEYSAIPWTGADAERDGKPFYAADRVEKADEPRMPWRPSIHMPRWASRILLDVTSVRLERLQDITEDDAWAEGISQTHAVRPGDGLAVQNFAMLWDRINGKRTPWARNPWVWVLELRVQEPRRG